MEETRGNRPQSKQSPASITGQESKKPWLKTSLLVLALVVAMGTVGFFGSRVFRRAGRPRQPDAPRSDVVSNTPEARQGPSTSSRTAPQPATSDLPPAGSSPPLETPAPATPAPLPIAPDPPPPESAAELMEEAKLNLDRAVLAFPDDPDVIEVKARLLYYSGDSSAAAESWERCLELNPGYAYAYHGLGRVAAKKANYEEAVALQRKALTLIPGFSDAALALADSLMKLGKIEEAVKVLEDDLRANPESIQSHAAIGHAYLQANEYAKARDAFSAVLGLQPNSPRAQFGLTTALARLGQGDESKKAMERFKQLEAEKTEVRTEVRARFDDLREMCTRVAVHYTHAGRVYLAHGLLTEAERLCRRAAVLDSDNTDCRIQLAALYQRNNRPEESLEMCRQLTRIAPENSIYQLNLGVMYANLGHSDAAEETLKEVIRLAPGHSEGHASLARLYLHGGRQLAEAQRLAREAVRIDRIAPNYFLLSQACAAGADRAGAISALREAIRLDPDNPRYPEALKLLQESE